jgi:Cu/Ag efflux protein CusF
MTRHARRLGALLGIALYAAGCGHDPPITDARYHLRGVVAAISDVELSIHHEAIPHFKDRDGHDSSMASMTMIFGLAAGVSPASLRVGDKIAFDFDLRWSTSPALLLTKLEKLPADTPLVLSGE